MGSRCEAYVVGRYCCKNLNSRSDRQKARQAVIALRITEPLGFSHQKIRVGVDEMLHKLSCRLYARQVSLL
jgi:hypothetical protein